jgi:hypothetical protein
MLSISEHVSSSGDATGIKSLTPKIKRSFGEVILNAQTFTDSNYILTSFVLFWTMISYFYIMHNCS